jgi:hypothetical protein
MDLNKIGAGLAQSVYLTIDWTAGVRSPTEEKYFFSGFCVQTNSEVHPATYPVGIGGPFPWGKADADVTPI